jgi:hypothetical protein
MQYGAVIQRGSPAMGWRCRLAGYIVLAAASLAPMASARASSINILNSSFESGNFSSWTAGGNLNFTYVVNSPSYLASAAADGHYYALAGPQGSPGTLSQTFSATAGNILHVSAWISAMGDSSSLFSMALNGVTFVSLTNPNMSGKWLELSFDAVATGMNTLKFAFQDNSRFIALDYVTVTQTAPTAVPLPGALPLFVGGLGVIGWLGRRRRRNQTT